MNVRMIRIELRRSAAVGVGLLVLVAGAVMLLSFPEGFAGRWIQLAHAGRLLLMIMFSLALAGGAWLGRRDARAKVGELFATTARPRWQRVQPAAVALALTVVLGYLTAVALGTVWVIPSAEHVPAGAFVVAAVGALSLPAAAWLGMAAGRAMPHLVTAPLLAVAAVAVTGLLPDWVTVQQYVEPNTPAPSALLLSPVFSGSIDDFQTVAGRVSAAQALWFVALAVTGLLLFGATRRRTFALGAVPAVAGAAVAVALLPAGGASAAFVTDPGAVAPVCDDDGPQVCVTAVHAAMLPQVVGPAREALTLIAAKLPAAPTRAAEDTQPTWSLLGLDSPGIRRDPTVLIFESPYVGRDGRADLEGSPLLPAMLEEVWQQDCGDDNSVSSDAWDARRVAAAWLAGAPPTAKVYDTPESIGRLEAGYTALTTLPEEAQKGRMARARDAALDCRDDEFAALVLGTSS